MSFGIQARLEPLYSAEQMRALDRWAIDQMSVPSLELMERAGAAVADAVLAMQPTGKVTVVCGKGNNGGDGFVCARRLAGSGLKADVLLVGEADELSADARANFDRYVEDGGQLCTGGEAVAGLGALEEADVVVDALLGTGFSGEPRDAIAAAIAAINRAGCPVVAVDVPSGIDASSGEVATEAVWADRTVTFEAAKLGLWIQPGKSYVGQLKVAAIGIPAEQDSARPSGTARAIGPSLRELLPRRDAQSTKFSSGVVTVVGGSPGLTGAACLAARSALRAGAGYVRAAVPASLNAIFEAKLTEVMTLPLPDRHGHLAAKAADPVLVDARGAFAIGPGLGRDRGSQQLVLRLVERCQRPLVLDADALFALAGQLGQLKCRQGSDTVITPHAGELARLLAVDVDEVEAGRLASARRAAELSGAVVVLKGDDTLVVTAQGEIAVNTETTPALATAGSGDVLAGVVAAMMAKGLSGFEAACLAVFLHSQAAIAAADQIGVEGVVAGDVIAALPGVLS